MSRVSTYLNFAGSTEAAFRFYQSVFGTEFSCDIARFKDAPPHPGCPAPSEIDGELILHIELPILGGHVLMGTDVSESMGYPLHPGNNVYINLEPDTRAETDALFAALSAGGTVEMALQEMFWGGYFGSFTDRFGTRWMVNCANKD